MGGSSAKRRLASFELLTQTKVRHQDARLPVLAHGDQDVLGFKVPVDNAQAVQVAQSVGHLIQYAGHVALASLRQFSIQVRLLDDIGQRRLAEFKRDIKEGGTLLLRKVADNCRALAVSQQSPR
jgi:hypothetical protein